MDLEGNDYLKQKVKNKNLVKIENNQNLIS
jgi:hypothetical protein